MRSFSLRFLSIMLLLMMLLSPAVGSAGTVPEGFTVFHGSREVPQFWIYAKNTTFPLRSLSLERP